MTRRFTTPQQINVIEKRIRLEQYKYTLALEEGEPNSCMEDIIDKIRKLTVLLKCLNHIQEEKAKMIMWKQIKFVDNYNQNVEQKKVLVEAL